MRIYLLEQLSADELMSIIAKCNFIPFKEYGVKKDLITNYVIGELSNIVSQGGFVLVAEEYGEIDGLVSLERSQWDSKHFGIEIAKINHLITLGENPESFGIKQKLISHLLKKCRNNGVLNISARVYKEDLSSIHALESCDFRLMDVLVTYFFDLQQKASIHPETRYCVRKFKQDEIPKLAEIARECFKDSPVSTDHFHADPTLPKEKSGELYVKWLIDSCHEPTDTVLVAEIDGEPVGFDTCTVHKSLAEKLGIRLGSIILIAVKPSFRGKFVATSLLNAALAWFADKADIVESSGQVSNYAIQRAWCRTGFKIVRSQCTFHWSPQFES